jgi:hypothetical protein
VKGSFYMFCCKNRVSFFSLSLGLS